MRNKKIRIVVTGGGSGGHITPNLAVAHELKRREPEAEIIYIGQKGDKLIDVPAHDPSIDRVCTVRAGKLRRYYGEGLKQLLDLPTVFKNIRDVVWVLTGIWQSFWLLRQLKPDVIFVKGGFVGVPVGLAAAALRIPFVTHDSDALPGLANRIIARWAQLHAVALPKEIYHYPADKTVTVGVPIARQYTKPTSAKEQRAVRSQLGLPADARVLLVTGGGNGAARLNDWLLGCAPQLFARYSDLIIVHLAGRDKETVVRQAYHKILPPAEQGRAIIKGFVTNLYDYSAVANVVVARASGTTLAELAAQSKACVIVPNPQLTGGHQTKNAQALAKRKAVRLVDEDTLRHDPQALMPALTELLDHPDKATRLGAKLHELALPDATERLAVLLLDVAK